MRKWLKHEANSFKCLVAPLGEAMGTPGLLVRTGWHKAEAVMSQMLLSMTPPIPVHSEDAVDFIQRCISGAEQQRLTESDTVNGEVVQLYCLSYRHESADKLQRLSTRRLEKAVEVIKSHASNLGNSYFSVWIDSLFWTGRDPLSEWSDRGLAPYSLCYVVVLPSQEGFAADLERAWIRCEHQLAASARGVLLHLTEERPKWSQTSVVQSTGNAHVQISGANLYPNYALRGLALAVCGGLLRNTTATFKEDLQNLQKWAVKVMCAQWNTFDFTTGLLPRPIGIAAPARKNRMRNFMKNTFSIGYRGTLKRKQEWDFIREVDITRITDPQRPWNTGYEVANALCGQIGLSAEDGFDEGLFREIESKSKAYLVLCGDVTRGIVACDWDDYEGHTMLLDVEMDKPDNRDEGCCYVQGYSIIHCMRVRQHFPNFLLGIFDEEGELHQNPLIAPALKKWLNTLTVRHYSKLGLEAKALVAANTNSWVFGHPQ